MSRFTAPLVTCKQFWRWNGDKNCKDLTKGFFFMSHIFMWNYLQSHQHSTIRFLCLFAFDDRIAPLFGLLVELTQTVNYVWVAKRIVRVRCSSPREKESFLGTRKTVQDTQQRYRVHHRKQFFKDFQAEFLCAKTFGGPKSRLNCDISISYQSNNGSS